MTIDNIRQAKALMRKMKTQLPIPVRATGGLARLMKPHSLKLKRGQELSIKALFYSGDGGGILCDVTQPGIESAVVCSLTQVEIGSDHPLAEEIRAYQQARKKGLARAGRRPTSTIIEPRKKKRRRRRRR